MYETVIERQLKSKLESRGFKVLKLYTPGETGAMDRIILRPKYWPGEPMFVELKRPGKHPRPLQEAKAADWRARGVKVLAPINSLEKVNELVDMLFEQSYLAYSTAVGHSP